MLFASSTQIMLQKQLIFNLSLKSPRRGSWVAFLPTFLPHIKNLFKGTVWPLNFWFFKFTLEYFKRLQSSETLHAKINLTSCLFGSSDHRLHRILSSYLAGALLFDGKIYQIAALFWFGFRDVGIIYSQTVSYKAIDVYPAFLEHGSAEKITVWAHANRDQNK
jgi:hypothetical protein